MFSELIGEIGALVRNEIRLAKAEVAEKLRSMAIGLALTIAGVFLLILALWVSPASSRRWIDAARP